VDVSEYSSPDRRRVRVLRAPGAEASTEIGRNRQTCPLDVGEHQRLQAVLFCSGGELVE
jgi:hypothetical protein